MSRDIRVDVSGMWYFQEVDFHGLSEERIIEIVREDIGNDPWTVEIDLTHIDTSEHLSQSRP